MGAYLLRRLGYMLVTLLVIATATFFLMKMLPGTPFNNDRLTDQQLANMNAKYGLDQPVAIQYLRYMANLAQGDLGDSYKYVGRSVTEVIAERIGPSALIGFQALVIGTLIGLALGVVSALKHNSLLDYTAVTLAVLGMSIPSFVFAALLQYYVGLKWGILPPALWKGYEYTILPTLALSVTVIATVARFIRTEMLDVINQDYVLTASAKGLNKSQVIIRHVLRNALIPVVTMLGPLAVNIMTGTLVIEKIFSVPGLGEQFSLSVIVNDYGVIMGITLFYSCLFIVMVFLVDLLYGLLDPRINLRGGKQKG